VDDPQLPARNRPVRDRDVVVTAALVIAAVLIIARVTGFVPVLDDLIGLEPLVIIALVVVTIGVLVIALRPRRS
jgi:Na+(H+)/acetate symporter ActP